MTDTENAPKDYRGSCHCGAFVYEITIPEVKTGTECNCSICHKKGYLLANPGGRGNFKLVKGDEDKLSIYRFGSEKIEHKFCPTCGVAVLASMKDGPAWMDTMINAPTIQGLNIWELETKPFNGKDLGVPYEEPKHKGELPKAQIENGQHYEGSCHCGAVTLAVISKPLDETYEGRVMECNCSMCQRAAYIWIYPGKDEVVLTGKEEDIGRYSFGRHMLNKTFCRRCGSHLTNENKPLTEEEYAKLPEADQKLRPLFEKSHPVNLRMLHEVDVSKLKVTRNPNGINWGPSYVNP